MYDKYIGIPYLENGRSTSGLDCWGLVRLFYKQEFNIELPSYVEEYSGSYDPKLPETIENYKDSWTKTCAPKLGDVCLFNMLGEPTHVGIYLGENKFLHARQDQASVIESTQRPIWRNRLEGIYSYTPKSSIIQLTGMPHPFKQGKILEFIADGTTVKDCVNFITEKYKISARLVKQIIVFVDGVRIASEQWATTVLKAGQQVTYKTVPQGKNALRTILMIAVIVIAYQFGGPLAAQIFGTTAPWAVALSTMAITAVGMTLVNAIAPIRPPKIEPTETSQQLNLFSGSTNRGNPYGAIPVVLGRLQFTPPLGSQPYIDTQTTTSYMHMQLVWGFGPLRVDPDQFYIGASKIDSYYTNNLANEIVPKPVTVQGLVNRTTGLETETEAITAFNKLYPSITEQQFKNVDLVNDPANTEVITFQETEATKVQAIISFPEGLRKINIKDGKSSASEVKILAVLEKLQGNTVTTVSDWATNTAFTYTSIFARVPNGADYDGNITYTDLYQKTIFCITPKNGIVAVSGTPSQQQGVNPTSAIIKLLKDNSLASLIPDIDNNYTFEPVIPSGYKPLYNIVHSKDYFSINDSVVYDLASSVTTTTASRTNVLTSSTFSHNGWVFTTNMIVEQGVDGFGNSQSIETRNWSISISPGTLGSSIDSSKNLPPTTGGGLPSVQTIWTTKQMLNTVATSTSAWGSLSGSEKTFMNEYAVWYGTGTTFDHTVVVNFPYEGLYTVQLAADNRGEVIIDGGKPIVISENSYRSKNTLSSGSAPIETTVYVNAGNKSVRIKGFNYESNTVTTLGGSNAGVAVRILFKADNLTNYVPGSNYILIGDNEFSNYKDGFNFPITWDNLAPGQYRVKLTRTSVSDPDYQTDYRHSFRTQFLSATAFKAGVSIQPPRGVGICRTGLVIESSGKVNGQIDGVNALVDTLGWDYVTQPDNTKAWVDLQPINNPASLFLHVLGHSANAYRLTLEELINKVDLEAIQDWHTYCNTAVTNVRPVLTYNGIVSSTTSVLDVLKDICAAGMASPVFIDGKWSVVIDRQRPHVVQHFTPHNSWGFEATKNLPKLPDALRISFPDERNSFQITEILVSNFGKTVANAKIIEEIQLPGITRVEQARYFARWHLAQMYYRPEIFTINVDFEYLVCTRGDRVKVTHDVPLWGYGSGRIKSISASLTQLTLTEPVYLEAGRSYQIRIRTDNLSSAVGSGSIERTIATISTSGYYSTLTLSSAVDSSVKVDDLFMVGELNKVTQDLLVQTVAPTSNTTAALTLVEYTDSIYNFEFRPFDPVTPDLPSYIPLISKRIGSDVTKNTIAKSPTIISVESRTEFSEQLSQGNYQNITIITWENALNLPIIAEKVEFQIVPGSEQFNSSKQLGIYVANKSATSYIVKGLQKDQVYKFRARYTNGTGNIVGPWSTEYSSTIDGKNNNRFVPYDVSITLQDTFVYVKPMADGVPDDFNTYEFRIYKLPDNTSVGDFWDLDPSSNPNILVAKSKTQAVFNLLDFKPSSTNKVISNSGVRYKIACRAVNNTNNYSYESALGSILIKTIQ
jgi:hypothetical protein